MTGAGPHDPAASGAPGDEPVGSVGEEALKLLRALSAANRPEAAASAPDAKASDDHSCPNGWCPVCGVVALVRDNPEAIHQVTESATTLLRGLKDLYDAAVNPKDHLS